MATQSANMVIWIVAIIIVILLLVFLMTRKEKSGISGRTAPENKRAAAPNRFSDEYNMTMDELEDRKSKLSKKDLKNGPKTDDLKLVHKCGGRPQPGPLGWGEDSVLNDACANHLWIVHRSIELLEASTMPNAQTIAAWLRFTSTPAGGVWQNTFYHDALVKGLFDADHMNPWGTNIFACHFYSPVTHGNFLGNTGFTAPVYAKKAGDIMNAAYANISAQGAGTYPNYPGNDLLEFFYYLGIVTHYLTDQTQPMHAHNLPNALRPANDKFHSNFEDFAQEYVVEQPDFFTIRPTDITPANTWQFSNTTVSGNNQSVLMAQWVADAAKDGAYRYNHPFSYPGDGFMSAATAARYPPLLPNYPAWAKQNVTNLIQTWALGPPTIGPWQYSNSAQVTACTGNCWTDVTWPEANPPTNKPYNIDDNCYFCEGLSVCPNTRSCPTTVTTNGKMWATSTLPLLINSTRQAITITAGFLYNVLNTFYPNIIRTLPIPPVIPHSSSPGSTEQCLGGYQCVYNGSNCVSIYTGTPNSTCSLVPGSSHSDPIFGNYGTCTCKNATTGTSCKTKGDSTVTCFQARSINPATGVEGDGNLLGICTSNSSYDGGCKLNSMNQTCYCPTT